MKNHFFRLLAVAFTFVFIAKGSAQVDSMITVYAEQFPAEKIHVHFDKTIYNKEETIWYKIYILQNSSELTNLSKNVYVEWYDTTGRLIKQTVAPLYQSTAKGSFDIPAEYRGNNIHMKAFTRWMLNDDPAFSYEKELLVNTSTVRTTSRPAPNKTKVEIFPESGFLIQGLNTRIAFKATNQFGNPVFIKGLLVDEKNKTLDTLKVKHDGMGSFYLMPDGQTQYRINWTDENGVTGSTPVPVTKKQGAKISVKTTNDKAKFQVERTDDVPENFKHMTLLVHMNQNPYYKISLNLSERTNLNAEVPIDEMPTGVLQFTLFTSDWVPVAERIVFINNRMHEFNAKVTAPIINLNKRGKNVFEVFVPDTLFANMSLAVTDAALNPPDQNTIYSDILLSSEIRGKIYNPGYYLASDADSVTAHLDLVMMTNGWRRFDWEKIKANTPPKVTYPVETEYMKMEGKVLGLKPGSSSVPIVLNMIVVGKDSSKQFLFTPVEKDGSFQQRMFFYDTARVYYTFNQNKKLSETTQVQFDNGLLRQQAKTIQLDNSRSFVWNDSVAQARLNQLLMEQELLKKRMASSTLQEVIVKTRTKSKEQILDEKYSTGLFSGGDAQTFDLTDDKMIGSQDIIAYLQGRVAGLQISGQGANATMTWRGGTPDLFVNESPSDMDMVTGIPVTDIAMVKVFRPPFFGAAGGGGGGAIAIYLKKGADGRKADPNAKGLDNALLGGYSRFKEFYNPSYEKPTDGSADPDSRTTLYWNPYIITNKKSPRVRVQFFNNDFTKKFQVVLEGINAKGKMVRVVRMIDAATKAD
ncbi:hypothetical protein GWC95_16065 [Sediminibacterium roseum]|uniref:TonB-dependent Receptor Plug Domain n=1 Tax=Sediminibacterium roseum TaxID=1978412 RepID=A0ABW9ZWD7_9BACT|nr:hypothetical protein [Sediminibacterium roseum]NCI51445.1 hypothetical protein [Sediminibacterium roseum]